MDVSVLGEYLVRPNALPSTVLLPLIRLPTALWKQPAFGPLSLPFRHSTNLPNHSSGCNQLSCPNCLHLPRYALVKKKNIAHYWTLWHELRALALWQDSVTKNKTMKQVEAVFKPLYLIPEHLQNFSSVNSDSWMKLIFVLPFHLVRVHTGQDLITLPSYNNNGATSTFCSPRLFKFPSVLCILK